MNNLDTIVALITPAGKGAISVVRISGPETITIAYAMLGKLPNPRQAEYTSFLNRDGSILDQGIAIFFSSPNSFTGEDVLELQGHGSQIVVNMLLQCILSFSRVRIARPGEFSERAFLNNKLDLIQAEAISDLINSNSIQAARSAIRSLQGVFSQRITELIDDLSTLRMHVEANIDFSDEHQNNIACEDTIRLNLESLIVKFEKIQKEASQGSVLREGIKVVIAGKPNAGKSSLFNILTKKESAIVTSIAGTTRDVLREYIYLNNIPLYIIDTAGLHNSKDEIEQIGIKHAWNEIKKANHILLIVDSTMTPIDDTDILVSDFSSYLSNHTPITVVRNKIDITKESTSIIDRQDYTLINVSIQYGIGIELLVNHLIQCINYLDNDSEGYFLARQRHLYALQTAYIHICQGKKNITDIYMHEFLAEELKLAQQALGEIIGKFSSRDLLNKIFSHFCIGK